MDFRPSKGTALQLASPCIEREIVPVRKLIVRNGPAWPLVVCVLWVAVLLGCTNDTGGIERYSLRGEVNYEGEPVTAGTITLEPDAARGNKGPASTALIENGTFVVEQGRGVVGGPYLARLTGYPDSQRNDGPDTSFGKPLFQDHEVSLELPKEDGTYSFDIQK